MSFTVYGIRLKGDTEVRYIGQTAGRPCTRLSNLACSSYDHGLSQWLAANRSNIEAFEITQCATRREARASERFTILLCLRLNHRIFNREHVPQHLRPLTTNDLVPPELRAA